ncbi:hypothetical protein L9F63_016093 [Diploptera punctata]|uniref:Ionotropic glutamate receptor C-terminal domain-containing protein n=1 Tax=Diploptera punctata TaxID=6984 RepID=A0AAD8A1W2_DIPPU|nr:hypothetical protein L9F63_016093 [Diploptera punctata]
MAIISFRNVTFANEVINNDEVLFFLTHCILDIARDNFNKDMPIAIQTPGSWSKAPTSIFPSQKTYTESIFFTWFNLRNTIPYKILGHMENFKNKSENGPKSGSHILLVPNREISTLLATLKVMIQRMKYNYRNVRAKTLIVLLDPAKSQRDVLRLSYAVLQTAFNEGQLENAIVIIPLVTLDKRSRKYMMSVLAVGWLPQEQENICSGIINNPKIAEVWTSEGDKYQYRELFPNKQIKNMKQCSVRVHATEFQPYVVPFEGGIGGFFPNIIHVASEVLNFRHNISDEDPFIVIPSFYHKGTQECTVMYPYVRADFTWYVPSGVQIPGWRNIIGIFTPTTWFLVLLAFILRTVTHWLLAIVSNRCGNTQMETNFVCVLMSSFSSQLGMGCKENYKGSVIVCFFVLWIYYCLQIYTLYQSSLFGCLLKPTEYQPIKSLKELQESDIEMLQCVQFDGPGTKLNQTYDKCRKYRGEFLYNRKVNNIAFFDLVFSHNLYDNLHKALGIKIKYVTLEEVLLSEYTAISVIRLGCMFYDKLNTIQHRLYSSGIVNQWMKEMTEKIWRNNFREKARNDVNALKLSHLQGVFYLLSIGLMLGLIVFVIEYMVGCVKKCRK